MGITHLASTILSDLTHDGRDELILISKTPYEVNFRVYSIMDEVPTMIYEDSASDNHAGWKWYYLYTVDNQEYLLQYIPEIWNGMGTCHLDIFSFHANNKEELFSQDMPYDAAHISEQAQVELKKQMDDFKENLQGYQKSSIPLITIGSDALTGKEYDYIIQRNDLDNSA